MKYITFSFDDGFYRSTKKTAQIFESFGLICEFNVVAKFLLESNEFTDFDFLNELQSRGHIIQPHGYNHIDKGNCDYSVAVESIEKCIDVFTSNLENFDPKNSVFCFPYNSSNKQIEQYAGERFRAFRTGYNKVFNEHPHPHSQMKTKMIFGDAWPEPEKYINIKIKELEKKRSGWLVFNLHGLDGEGWEPVSSDFLSKTLEGLLKKGEVKILPVIKVLEERDGQEA